MIDFIRPDFGPHCNSASRTRCYVIGNNQSARCAARHGRRSDGIGPIKSALRSEVQVAVVLHIDIRVDNVVLRIDFSLNVVFLGRFAVVSDDKVSAVKVGFLCFQTAAVNLDKAVVNGEFAGLNISRVVTSPPATTTLFQIDVPELLCSPSGSIVRMSPFSYPELFDIPPP